MSIAKRTFLSCLSGFHAQVLEFYGVEDKKEEDTMQRAWNLATIARRIFNDPRVVTSRYGTRRWKYLPQRRQICSTERLRDQSKEENKTLKDEGDRLAKIRAEDAARNKIIHMKVKPSEVKAVKAALSKHVASFERAASIKKSKDSFFDVIDNFLAKDRTRRGHMEFLKTAMAYMEEFGLEKDVEAYNRLLDVFPRGRYVNRTLFDAIWAKKHPQAELALEILTEMEDHWLLPNENTYDVLYEIFGHASQPLQKCRRMIYWYHKLEEMFPNPYPKVLPENDAELSKLALTRMTKDEQIIMVYKVIWILSLKGNVICCNVLSVQLQRLYEAWYKIVAAVQTRVLNSALFFVQLVLKPKHCETCCKGVVTCCNAQKLLQSLRKVYKDCSSNFDHQRECYTLQWFM